MRVRVAVSSSARREHFEEVGPNVFVVFVREKPERNEANERVRLLLARHFHVLTKSVHIISGRQRKKKTFEISF